MRLSATFLSDVRADQGTGFWLWFAIKLTLGVAQMVGAVAAAILFFREGPSTETMAIALSVAAVTTLSILLFRVLGWKPVKR